MKIDYSKMNLVDLISERHKELRNKVRYRFKESFGEDISNTETYILSLIENNEITMAEIARVLGISRQAVHKCVKKLSIEGYVELINMDSNQKEKIIKLTESGKVRCKVIDSIKDEIDYEINTNLGEEKANLLREILMLGVLTNEKE